MSDESCQPQPQLCEHPQPVLCEAHTPKPQCPICAQAGSSPGILFKVLPGLFTAILIAGFLATLFWLTRNSIPDGNKDTFFFMAGQLSTFCGMGLGFWYQTTFHSNQKTEFLAKSPALKPEDMKS